MSFPGFILKYLRKIAIFSRFLPIRVCSGGRELRHLEWQDIDLPMIARVAGHADIKTTRYTLTWEMITSDRQ